MKVVCINNKELDGAMDDSVNLTIGKTYQAIGNNISKTDYVYNIINDINQKGSYYHKRFKPLEEFRLEKLNKLGI
jgi:hypothetical protein